MFPYPLARESGDHKHCARVQTRQTFAVTAVQTRLGFVLMTKPTDHIAFPKIVCLPVPRPTPPQSFAPQGGMAA